MLDDIDFCARPLTRIKVLPVGGGSGTGRMSYLVPPLDAIKAKAASQNNDALVQYILNNTLITARGGFSLIYPRPPDVCLVFLKTWATEGYDRPSLLVSRDCPRFDWACADIDHRSTGMEPQS